MDKKHVSMSFATCLMRHRLGEQAGVRVPGGTIPLGRQEWKGRRVLKGKGNDRALASRVRRRETPSGEAGEGWDEDGFEPGRQ